MRCSTFRKRVVAFADGELPDRLAEQMAAHAVSCASCADELATVRQEGARYGATLWRRKAPPDLAGSVMAAVADREPDAVGLRAWLQPTIPLRWTYGMAGAAATVAIVLVGVMGSARHMERGRATSADYSTAPTLRFASSEHAEEAGRAALPFSSRASAPSSPRAKSSGSPELTRPFWSVSYVATPIRQSEPAFAVEKMAEEGPLSKGDVDAWNRSLGAPESVSEQEQRVLNAPGRTGAYYGGPGPNGALQAPATPPLPGEEPAQPSSPFPAVSVDSTDATVVLTVSYRRDGDEYTTLYQADFAADYIIRAPDVERKGVRIAVTFPFPTSCTTVSGSKLTVDDKEDEAHTAYSISGIRWVGWFQPNEKKSISIAYSARGEGNYRYALDKNRLAKKFRLLMKIEGLEPGHDVEIPGDSLQPARPGRDVPGSWDYVWDHERLLTTKDVAVNFPPKASPTASANRVMQTAGGLLWVVRFAPLFLVIFLGALGLSALWNRAEPFRGEELALLGLAFLLFYPLFLFGAAYVGQSGALWGATAIVAFVSSVYALFIRGSSFATRVVLLQTVLLGACTHALLDPAIAGLVFTGGALALLAYFMVLHAGTPRVPLTSGPAQRPQAPAGATSPGTARPSDPEQSAPSNE